MKKIMKKALSLMLALVLVFTLAPMSANAAVGDAVPVPPWQNCIYSGDTVTVATGETVFFEMCGEGNSGTFDFVVEGTGDFDVTICTEDGNGAYLDGESISAVDGCVETAMTFYESTYYYCAFSITNNSDADADYVCSIVFPQGTQGNPENVVLGLEGTVDVVVPAGAQYYISAKLPEAGVEYDLKMTGNTGFGYTTGYGMPNWDVDGVVTTTVQSYNMGATVTFAIANQTGSDITVTLDLNAIERPIGHETNPEVLTTLSENATKYVEDNEYWYVWTATEAGTFTLTMNNNLCSDGWTYKAICGDDMKHFSTGWDESDKNVCEFSVVAGDEVTFGLSIPTYYGESIGYDPYTPSTGTIVFSTSFVAGTGSGEGSGEGAGTGSGEGEGTGTVTGEEINENYYYNYTELGVGAATVFPEFGYTTTLYTFTAATAGTYTITLSDTEGTVGYYGSNEWFPYDYSQDTGVANTYTYTLNYTQANAPALIGISGTIMTDITIEKAGEAEEEEGYEKVEWPLTVSPEAYTFDGKEEDLIQFIYSITDDKVAFSMDEDGYFHVVPETDLKEDAESIWGYTYVGTKPIEECPLVLVDLSDKVVSLEAALAERTFLATMYDENGEVDSIIDFTPALKVYLACADKETGLYPLTFDLLEVFVVGGESAGWYMNTESSTGIVASAYPESDGVDPDSLFTFAMYYLEQQESVVEPENPTVKPENPTVEPEKPVYGKDEMASIVESNKAKDTVIITSATVAGKEVEVKFTFAANTMKPVAGKDKYDFTVELVEDHSKATADKATIEKDTFVLRINFAYTGELPGKATITIPVGEAYKNTTLYYYQITETGALKYVCDAPVDANGNAKVTQDHCSDYVLLKEKVVPEAPKTGDTTNFALWFAILGLGVVAIAGSVVMKKREF